VSTAEAYAAVTGLGTFARCRGRAVDDCGSTSSTGNAEPHEDDNHLSAKGIREA
jgi:hypothetical protein